MAEEKITHEIPLDVAVRDAIQGTPLPHHQLTEDLGFTFGIGAAVVGSVGVAAGEITRMDHHIRDEASAIFNDYWSISGQPYRGDNFEGLVQVQDLPLSLADYVGLQYARLTELKEIDPALKKGVDKLIDHAEDWVSRGDTGLHELLQDLALSGLRNVILQDESEQMAASLITRSSVIHGVHQTVSDELEKINNLSHGIAGAALHTMEKVVGDVPVVGTGLKAAEHIAQALNESRPSTQKYLSEVAGRLLRDVPNSSTDSMEGLARGLRIFLPQDLRNISSTSLAKAVGLRMLLRHAREIHDGADSNDYFKNLGKIIKIAAVYDANQDQSRSILYQEGILQVSSSNEGQEDIKKTTVTVDSDKPQSTDDSRDSSPLAN